MRLLLFVLVFGGLTVSLHAQEEWVDYLVGRPDVFYLDAKRAEAKAWGINYRVEAAGCVDCANTRLRTEEVNQQNERYFELLERRYGSAWLQDFNKAVAKRHNAMRAAQTEETAVWYDYVPLDGDSEYYDTKKEVAKEWGIDYQLLFPNPAADPLEKEQEEKQLRQKMAASYDYQMRLQNRLGEHWQDWIEQQTQLRLLQKTIPQKGSWTDVVWGMPDTAYYEAKKQVAEEWGIQYQTRFLGNERTPMLVQQQQDLLRQNARYFSTLNRHFKGAWLTAFHREVQQAYGRRQL